MLISQKTYLRSTLLLNFHDEAKSPFFLKIHLALSVICFVCIGELSEKHLNEDLWE